MYDTVVVALVYRLEHGDSVDYESAAPMQHQEPGFSVRVDNREVRFEFKGQHATEQEARESIREYIQEWELVAGLRHGPDAFKLRFLSPEIQNRDAPPGTVGPVTISSGTPRITATATVGLSRYPEPPSGVKITPDVQSMYDRYMGYRQGREPLASMAYFCLTVVEQSTGRKSGGRRAAAREFQVSGKVLGKIARLSSEGGGSEARKASGRNRPLTPRERRFLDEAIKVLIRRAAQKAHSPASAFPLITKSDLPSL